MGFWKQKPALENADDSERGWALALMANQVLVSVLEGQLHIPSEDRPESRGKR